MIQWTAGIRLAMYEYTTLQEAYTGALIAGKGRNLNNINLIMQRATVKHEDWARVRFGAGTPWRRCWCVITPPDEKEFQRAQKEFNKKKSAYDHSRPPVVKGDVKFYDTKKTKKAKPIATITNAYAAYAIYPQSKPLIDASTLVKVEGTVLIHSDPPSTTEGFVFVMPEVHPAVSGFEMMLRWLFPVFDTFGLYGRPQKLVADPVDPRGLMFGMPTNKNIQYLDNLDVSSLILTDGSQSWKEGEWRRRMKDMTSKRITTVSGMRRDSRYGSRRSGRNSLPSRARVSFGDGASVKSNPSITFRPRPSQEVEPFPELPRTDSAPPGVSFTAPSTPAKHMRSASEAQGLDRYAYRGSPHGSMNDLAPPPPPHANGSLAREGSGLRYQTDMAATPERVSSEDEQTRAPAPVPELDNLRVQPITEPVAPPPEFKHRPGAMPLSKPNQAPELRRMKSRMSTATLSQLAKANGGTAATETRPSTGDSRQSEDRGQRGVHNDANSNRMSANQSEYGEGSVISTNNRTSYDQRPLPPPPVHEAGFPQSSAYAQPNRSSDSLYATALVNGARSSGPVSNYTAYSPAEANRNQRSSTIVRKPLPARPDSYGKAGQSSAASTPQPQPGDGADDIYAMDQTAFDKIVSPANRLESVRHPNTLHRAFTNDSGGSIYDDNASTVSPDYASTIDEPAPPKRVERPRVGVLKTVGNTSDFNPRTDAAEYGAKPTTTTDIPDIDFGPTFNFASNKLPKQSTQPTITTDIPEIDFGPTYNYASDKLPKHIIPRKPSPADRPDGIQHSRSPSRNLITPEPSSHHRAHSFDSPTRAVPWQPGSSMGSTSPGPAITPEQFVQQRATTPTGIPLFSHSRQNSSSPQNVLRKTPPKSPRDIYNYGHSRSSSDLLLSSSRPHSRGASVTLGSGDYSNNLSAQEQTYVARVTGSPLISVAKNASGPSSKGGFVGGLVGTIEAREQEKKLVKKGVNNQAVQHAIAQRQAQAQQEQMYADNQSHMQGYSGASMQQPGRYLDQSQYGPPSPSHVRSNYVQPGTPPLQQHQLYGQPGQGQWQQHPQNPQQGYFRGGH